jgi:hypothetical protein
MMDTRTQSNTEKEIHDLKMKWIPCSERMPEEHDSIFARLYGTERWQKGMFRKRSEKVLVTERCLGGIYVTSVAKTMDGEWEKAQGVQPEIIAWMPFPEPYRPGEKKNKKGGENNDGKHRPEKRDKGSHKENL